MQSKIQFGVLLLLSILTSSCGGGGSSTDSGTGNSSDTDSADSGSTVIGDAESLPVDISLFKSGALVGDVTEVSCTLSDGSASSCYQLTIVGFPSDQTELGPFCPPTTTSTAEEGGIWFDGSDQYDIDGNFILNLPVLYGSTYTANSWILYDGTGKVNITDTKESCEAAARPDVDEAYQNYCVECSVDYIDGGQPTTTVTIPITPEPRTSVGSVSGNVGVSLNGVILAAPAPVDAILGAATIAAFDDCGGHVNPFEGYHYHGANGCSEGDEPIDGHSAPVAYALDGYLIYSNSELGFGNEDTDLDSCRGHADATRGYHYHAASAAENLFIGCYSGEIAR